MSARAGCADLCLSHSIIRPDASDRALWLRKMLAVSYLRSTGRIATRIAEDWRTILRDDPEAREQRVEREADELAFEEREALHRWEYRVEEVRQTMIGEKVDVEGMALLLNDRAHHGWRVKSIVSASVVGRMRPGLLVVFERQRS